MHPTKLSFPLGEIENVLNLVIFVRFFYNSGMSKQRIKLRDFEIGGDKLTILAGPCAIESQEILNETAQGLKEITRDLDINFVFKSSFDKANRSSLTSFRGPGLEKGLAMLQEVKEKFDLPIVTDIHEPAQAQRVAQVADIIQIPAFLCRQTDLLVSAGKTDKILNIKKGQFLAPEQMKSLIKKVEDTGNKKIMVTDRGTTFGYNNLVVDFRGIPIMKEFGYPVVFDATHSVQLPGANGTSSGGDRRFVPTLAKSAMASGADVLFFEIHPEPDKALCDGANMIALKDAKELFDICNKIFKLVRGLD